MPRDTICEERGCRRWVTSRRINKGATKCWEHEPRRQSFHISIGIEAAINLLKEGENPFNCTPTEALIELTRAQKKGMKLYSGCTQMGADGKCKGHLKRL